MIRYIKRRARFALCETVIKWVRRHWVVSCLAVVMVALLSAALWIPASILLARNWDETRPADAAIVLGAAVYNDQPSPVFLERIRHGVNLYKKGLVKKLVFTGGQAAGDSMAEAEAARMYAEVNGVHEADVLIETLSTTTWGNFVYAIPLLQQAEAERVLVVSDPMHMRRSMSMARALGIDAYASPTPTTRYTNFESNWHFLKHETCYYPAFLWRKLSGQLEI